MIETPFNFEPGLSDADYKKLAQLSLRWSLIDHVVGNCLKVMLRLTDEEAILIVFSMSSEQRMQKIKELSGLSKISPEASAALVELEPTLKALRTVRNNVAHAIVIKDEVTGDLGFHNRSKERTITIAQIFSTEELTNYAAHAVLAFRYALGFKEGVDGQHPLPARPVIPVFLQPLAQWPAQAVT